MIIDYLEQSDVRKDVVTKLFDNFINFIKNHFRNEENIMKKMGLTKIDFHIKAHGTYLNLLEHYERN